MMQTAGCDQAIKEVKESDVLEQMWLEISMMSKGSKPVMALSMSREQVANAGVAGAAVVDMLTGRGTKRSRGEKERDVASLKDTSNGAASNDPDAAAVGEKTGTEVKEQTRCELCNIVCDSRTVLEGHYAGKKHAARLKRSLDKDEAAFVGAAGTMVVDMLTGCGKKRSRGERERDQVLQGGLFNSAVSDDPDAAAVGEKAVTEEKEQTRCELCNIECVSSSALEGHFSGKKHAARLKRSLAKNEIACVGAAGAMVVDTLTGCGKKRSRGEDQVLQEGLFNSAASNGPDAAVEEEKAGTEEKEQTRCELCNIECHNTTDLEGHLAGKRHAARLKRKEQARCELCNIECNSRTDLEVHFAGKKHADHLERSLAKDEMACVGAAGATVVDTLTGRGKKRCRGGKERDRVLQKGAASNGPDAAAVGEQAGMGEREQTRCEFCNIECRHRAVLEIHFAGKKHAARLRRLMTKDEITGVGEAGSTAMDEKERGQLLQKGLVNATASNAPDVAVVGEKGGTEEGEQTRCELCNIECDSRTGLECHFPCKKHAACLGKMQIKDEISCVGAAGASVMDEIACVRAAGSTVMDEKERDQVLQKDLPISAAASNGPDLALVGEIAGTEEKEQTRCESCNIECDSRTVLGASIMDEIACVGAAGPTVINEKESDQVLQKDLTNSAASNGPDVAVVGEKARTEEKEQTGCELCNIQCDSRTVLEGHFTGKSHAVRLRRMLTKDDISCVGAEGASVMHIPTEKERHQVLQKGLSNDAASNGLGAAVVGENKGTEEKKQILCELCNIKCSSRTVLEGHFAGKKHAARLKRLLTANEVACVHSGVDGGLAFGREDKDSELPDVLKAAVETQIQDR